MTKKNNYKLAAFITGILFFIFFIYFSAIVKSKTLDNLDFDLMVKISDKTPRNLDSIMSFFSLVGSFEITGTILLVIILLRKRFLGFMVGAGFIIAHIIEIFGKALLNHPGPPNFFLRYDIPFLFPSTYVQPGFSYPSGHSLRISFLFILFTAILFFTKRLRISLKLLLFALSAIITVIMLYSRMSLGEHWPTDVIGGALLGIAFGLFSVIFL